MLYDQAMTELSARESREETTRNVVKVKCGVLMTRSLARTRTPADEFVQQAAEQSALKAAKNRNWLQVDCTLTGHAITLSLLLLVRRPSDMPDTRVRTAEEVRVRQLLLKVPIQEAAGPDNFDKGGSSLLPLTLAVHKVITSFPVTFLAQAQKDLPSQRPVFDF
ncbi:hypothetical protein C0Q70_18193 [Pomacea canaliculata]|uniref:Uncharacterized protein n=1 Tax=Pomacea canaliculata TaxID=400727 RepID=A0A2T7NMJ0_POMCA|nr:hypothetical protein C0Q70_18193 [Pomacea canaliculata]